MKKDDVKLKKNIDDIKNIENIESIDIVDVNSNVPSVSFDSFDFQKIKPVEKKDVIIKNAFSAMRFKKKLLLKKKYKDDIVKERHIARESIKAFSKSLLKNLKNVFTSFPFITDIDEVNFKLLSLEYDVDKVKKHLGNFFWAYKKIYSLQKESLRKLSRTKDLGFINNVKNSFIARSNSILNQINDSFVFLEEFRKFLKTLPVLKKGYFIVSIAGFPNVGKSTLLKKVTSANPEINVYPFTTKKLNLGLKVVDSFKIQFIDTPGTLNREKSNVIEKKAEIIISYSDVVVYVFDPSFSYSFEEQLKLFENITLKKKKVIVYFSKCDLFDCKKVFEDKISKIKEVVKKNDVKVSFCYDVSCILSSLKDFLLMKE